MQLGEVADRAGVSSRDRLDAAAAAAAGRAAGRGVPASLAS